MFHNPKSEGGSQDLQNMHNVFLPKIPSEQLSQLSQQNFGRQDSLSLCASLQNHDRNRPENMIDFMESEMNFEEYIGVLKNLDVQPEHIDAMFDDNELQKGNLLYDEGHQYDPYDHRPDMVPDQHGSSSERSMTSTPNVSFSNIKTEDEYWEYEPTTSTSTAPPRRRPARDNQGELINYQPKTKARKYVLKPDEEKKNPTYKLKRARNNDAVRKSRSKQKEMQVQRDRELDDLRNENIRLKAELALAQSLNAEQKQTIARMARR